MQARKITEEQLMAAADAVGVRLDMSDAVGVRLDMSAKNQDFFRAAFRLAPGAVFK